MVDNDKITFTYKELAEHLIKAEDIHEGLWFVFVEFGITAANISTSPDKGDVVPAAIVPLLKIGLHRSSEASPITVDAAQVNPSRGRKKKS